MNAKGVMKFSIGIPVRNGERYLPEAIRSALYQRRPADEILVVDDASTDGTREIATSSEWAGRVRYVYNKSSTGFADAFNRLARLAKGDYVVILCADDLLDQNCLASLEKGLLAFPGAGLCYTGFRYIDEKNIATATSPPPHSRDGVLYQGQTYSRMYLDGVRSDRHIHRCAGFAVDRVLLSRCPFRREAGLIADGDFFVRVGALTDVVGISEPLTSVRIHSDSLCNRLDSLGLQLAEDYLFQVRSHAEEPHRLRAEDVAIYHELAMRVLDGLFLESIKRGRLDLLQRAIDLQRELETYVPCGWRSHQLGWRQSLWHLTAKGGMLAWFAQRIVSGAAVARGVKRSLFRRAGLTPADTWRETHV